MIFEIIIGIIFGGMAIGIVVGAIVLWYKQPRGKTDSSTKSSR